MSGPPTSRQKVFRTVVQVGGFVGGIALLGWAVSMALAPENREQISKLAEATPEQIVGLFSLSAVSIVLNGLIFWVFIRPLHKLPPSDVIAVNTLASFLAYLPFKLGLVTRILIHHRRDRVPLLTIGAWIVAVAGSLVATLGPVLAVSMWRKGVDPLWWGASIGGVVLGPLALWVFARILTGRTGVAFMTKLTHRVEHTAVTRIINAERAAQIRSGLGMLGDWKALSATVVLRVFDALAVSARFLIAATVLGIAFDWQQAILLGMTFFLAGALSPFGEVGTREAATIGVAALAGVTLAASTGDAASNPVAVMILFVSGSESIVRIVCAALGLAWLRAGGMMRRKGLGIGD